MFKINKSQAQNIKKPYQSTQNLFNVGVNKLLSLEKNKISAKNQNYDLEYQLDDINNLEIDDIETPKKEKSDFEIILKQFTKINKGKQITEQQQKSIMKVVYAYKGDYSVENLGKIRIKLNDILGKTCQIVISKYNREFSWAYVANYWDEAAIEFAFTGYFFLIFQTQQERCYDQIEYKEEGKQVSEQQNSEFLKKFPQIQSIIREVGITDEILKKIIEIFEENRNKTDGYQSGQDLEKIRVVLNEELLNEWHIFCLKDLNDWGYYIFTENNDNMSVQFEYKQYRFLIFKTPQERED